MTALRDSSTLKVATLEATKGKNMSVVKTVGKREFIQHTSKYLKLVEGQNEALVITHHSSGPQK
ncbi:MAG: hypothetical protein NTW08_07290 [Gammaproteobacteria bacterium]|nr:hypothetical protein [Gammaproteobacteria bacterium]